MKKRIIVLVMIVILILSLTSCIPGSRDESEEPAGFFWGVWHGWIAPISLVLSLFKDSVNMYEINNSGFWYNLGFYSAIISGFGGLSLSRKHKKDD